MIINLNTKENIERKFELLKNKKYISLTNDTFILSKLIDDSYIQHKITKEEKNIYEMKLNKFIFQNNNKESIYIYSKKNDDDIERKRNMYSNKQLYFDDSPLLYDNYKNFISYFQLILKILSGIKNFF
jgi:hypothetical protein